MVVTFVTGSQSGRKPSTSSYNPRYNPPHSPEYNPFYEDGRRAIADSTDMFSTVIILLLVTTGLNGQSTRDKCKEGSGYYYTASLLEGLASNLCNSGLADEVYDLRLEVERLKGKMRRGSQENPGRSCRDVRQSGQTSSGIYWIQPDPDRQPFPIKVFCEMEFLGGGWTRVFNMMAKLQLDSSAVEMYGIISRNADIRVVLPNTTSTAIYTRGLRLQEYTQAVFGWAPSPDITVSHYGIMTKEEGLRDVCYLDKTCADRQDIGEFTSSVSGITRNYQTGYGANIAHVGIGYRAQAIVWGYDRNTLSNSANAGTFYSRWGNWNDTLPTTSGDPCCNSGATVDLLEPGDEWRYSILIR